MCLNCMWVLLRLRGGLRTKLSRTLDFPLLWLPTTATSGRSTLQSSGSRACIDTTE